MAPCCSSNSIILCRTKEAPGCICGEPNRKPVRVVGLSLTRDPQLMQAGRRSVIPAPRTASSAHKLTVSPALPSVLGDLQKAICVRLCAVSRQHAHVRRSYETEDKGASIRIHAKTSGTLTVVRSCFKFICRHLHPQLAQTSLHVVQGDFLLVIYN